MNYNYYDVIAFVYEKLGQKKNAEKAMLDYEQLEKVRSEEVHSIIKKWQNEGMFPASEKDKGNLNLI